MRVSTGDKAPILGAACFNLGVLGARVTHAFSQRVEALGVTHKQVGLLAVVDAGLARSQRDIAARLGVAPSLVVSLVDQLVEQCAVVRTRNPADRRVQLVETTEAGRELLCRAADLAADVDAELRATLSPAGRAALDTLVTEFEGRLTDGARAPWGSGS